MYRRYFIGGRIAFMRFLGKFLGTASWTGATLRCSFELTKCGEGGEREIDTMIQTEDEEIVVHLDAVPNPTD